MYNRAHRSSQMDPMTARILGLQSGSGLRGSQPQSARMMPPLAGAGLLPRQVALAQQRANMQAAPGRRPPLSSPGALPSRSALARAMANIQAAQQASSRGIAPQRRGF